MNTKFLKSLKVVVPLTLLGFLLWNILKSWDQLLLSWQNFNIFLLLLSSLLLLFVYPEAALAWHLLMKGMGTSRNISKTMYVWIMSNTSRYVPGFVWQYIGRVTLAQTVTGIPKRYTIASLLAEIFFSLAAASLVVLISLPSFRLGEIRYVWVILLPFFLIVLHPAVMSPCLLFIARLFKKDIANLRFYLSVKFSLVILLLHAFNFLLNGIALTLLISALGVSLTPMQMLFTIGSYALSWMVGYVTIFAPGGLGVTELTLAYFLSSIISFPLASLVAVMYRVLLSICEVIVFLIVLRIKP